MAVDAVVIGGGHNGLVAATLLARAGWSVEVLEQADVAGGAVGSLTTSRGYLHDWGAAFFGVLHDSPVFGDLGLADRVQWATTELPVAMLHGSAEPALLWADPGRTADGLGVDGPAWLALHAWWERTGARLFRAGLGPIPSVPLLRAATALGVRGGLQQLQALLEPVEAWSAASFEQAAARMLVTGHATHGDVAIDAAGSMPPALLLAMVAQSRGMPVPVGGAGMLAAAFVQAAEQAGVVVRTGVRVTQVVVRGGRAVGVRCADGTGIGVRRAVVADVAPELLARELVGEQHLPAAWLAQLRRHRYASGFCRLDVDLSAPAPWAADSLAEALVVHVTGDVHEVATAQAQVSRGLLPGDPALIVGQQDRADPARVPLGAATLWVECRCPAVPRGDAADELAADWAPGFADRMLDRLEVHAPGLHDLVVETTVTTPLGLQRRDPNLVGGDVAGGSAAPDQLLVFRPVAGWSPYAVPLGGLYLCGAATHPGGGVHGMPGRNAAAKVLRDARWRPGWMTASS